MKEKIFASLKTACGNTTSISDKTLEKIAEKLAVSVKEESQIEAAIELEKPILLAIDGNINFVTAEAVKKVKPVEKPVPPVDKPTDPNEPEWFKSYREKQDQETAALKNKLDLFDKEKVQNQLRSDLASKLKEKGIPDSYVKGRQLAIEKPEDIDVMVASVEADYGQFRQEMVEQGIIISVPKNPTSAIKEGEALGNSIAEKRNTNSSEGVKAKEV